MARFRSRRPGWALGAALCAFLAILTIVQYFSVSPRTVATGASAPVAESFWGDSHSSRWSFLPAGLGRQCPSPTTLRAKTDRISKRRTENVREAPVFAQGSSEMEVPGHDASTPAARVTTAPAPAQAHEKPDTPGRDTGSKRRAHPKHATKKRGKEDRDREEDGHHVHKFKVM